MRLSRNRARAGFIPVFFASVLATFWSGIFKMLLVLAAPIVALWWFGQPALLFEYWSHGPRSYPVYDKCRYLAFDGWHVVYPSGFGGPADCPTVKLLPVADFRKLILG